MRFRGLCQGVNDMVSYYDAARIILGTLKRDDDIPDVMSYVLHEADPEGIHGGVDVPLIEAQVLDVSRADEANTNMMAELEDASGRVVAKLYDQKWSMELQLDAWTVDGSDYDSDELGRSIRDVLYMHDHLGPNHPFEDESGEIVETIWDFKTLGGSRVDDLTRTPTVRRWRQRFRVKGSEQRVVPTEPIRSVDFGEDMRSDGSLTIDPEDDIITTGDEV